MTITTDQSHDNDMPIAYAVELSPLEGGAVDGKRRGVADASAKEAVPHQATIANVVEVPHASPLRTSTDTTRRSQLCCGSCCDVRTATIFVNIIYIIFSAMSIGGLVGGFPYGPVIGEEESWNLWYSDDYENAVLITGIVLNVLNVTFCALGIYGATNFQKRWIVVAGTWYAIVAVLFVIGFNWPSAILAGLFAYPHFALHNELKNGNITRENFHTVRYCCC